MSEAEQEGCAIVTWYVLEFFICWIFGGLFFEFWINDLLTTYGATHLPAWGWLFSGFIAAILGYRGIIAALIICIFWL